MNKRSGQINVVIVQFIELHSLPERHKPRIPLNAYDFIMLAIQLCEVSQARRATSQGSGQSKRAVATIVFRTLLVVTWEDWMSSLSTPEIGPLTPLVGEQPTSPALKYGC